MSSTLTDTPAQRAAVAQADELARALRDHRSGLGAFVSSRPGLCMADGWDVRHETLDGDFEFDSPIIQHLLVSGAGPVMRAAPTPSRDASPVQGASAVEDYLFPAPATAPVGSAQRVMQEVPGTVYGPGNVVGNLAATAAGALQHAAERDVGQLLRDGVRSILERHATRVSLAPNMELYNAAQGRQAPRVRLRVRALPLRVVTKAVPVSGGPVTQWRVNGPQTSVSLKVRGMNAQQMRNVAVMAGEQRLPVLLRFASGKVGGGVLAFAPSLALDAYSAIETDLQSGRTRFNTAQFVEASARSQSGNAVGFFGSMAAGAVVVAVTGGAIAGAPLVLIGLGVGIVLQVAWNASGMADEAGALAKNAMH